MVDHRLACISAQKWSNMWGRVGLLGLSAKNPEYIREYRNVIEQLQDPEFCYTLFPRDALDKRGNVTVLLLESFRAFNPKCLPGALFTWNRGLKGSLKATHVKTYPEGEKSRNGQSKEEWRLVLLQGCSTFMKSLENFEAEHKFSIGCGHVFIRGGVRRPSTNPAPSRSGTGRGRGRAPPPRTSATHNDPNRGPGGNSSRNDSNRGPGGNTTRSDRRRPSHGGGGGNNNNNQSYDRNYPRFSGASGGGRGRGGGDNTNNAPNPGGQAGPGRWAEAGER